MNWEVVLYIVTALAGLVCGACFLDFAPWRRRAFERVVLEHDSTHEVTLMNGLGHCAICGKSVMDMADDRRSSDS